MMVGWVYVVSGGTGYLPCRFHSAHIAQRVYPIRPPDHDTKVCCS